MIYCSKCGKQIQDNSKFCTNCGQAVANIYGAQSVSAQPGRPPVNVYGTQNTVTQPIQPIVNYGYGGQGMGSQPIQPVTNYNCNYNGNLTSGLLQRLSGKVHANAIIWLVIASLQVLIGFFNLAIGIALVLDYDYGTTNVITGIFVLIVAVMNYVVAARDMKYSKRILNQPTGIVARFTPIGGYIGTLIYNIFFGGIIGIAGSVYGLVIRNFVISNSQYFESIEQQYYQQHSF